MDNVKFGSSIEVMLHLEQFKKYYGNKLALEVPDYIFQGGIHWVKGQNGSGKTTLFRSVAGLLPFEGTIRWKEVSLKDHPVAYRKKVNYAEAEPIFPSEVSGKDLVRLYERHKKASAAQSSQLAERLGIHFLDQATSTYSSGMTKKLSLLLAFLGQAELILLDEPLVTLDLEAVETTVALIQEYHTEHGVSFLISSHQAFEGGVMVPNAIHQVANNQLNGISS